MKKITTLLSLIIIFNMASIAQKQHILKSSNISKPDTVWVFTPDCYKNDIEKEYPVIYLLHGWSGNYHQWNDIMDCQSYADEYGFIIVCPDGLYNSWYINSPVKKQSQFTDFFFSDLMPFIADNYHVDSSNVFITGLSMGGHGALYFFSRRPELFKNAGSISGVVDLSFCSNKYSIEKYLGLTREKNDEEILSKYSVIGNIEKIAASNKEIVFSCGTEDPFYSINNTLRRKCDSLKIKAVYISSPGTHNYKYWKSAIKYQFYFFNQKLKK